MAQRCRERAPSTTSDSAAVLNCRERQLILRWLPSRRMSVTAALGQSTKSLCDRGNLSACVLTRLEIADSGAWRPVLRIEVLSTSSKTGVSHEYGYRQPAASAHDRGHERAQALCGDTE